MTCISIKSSIWRADNEQNFELIQSKSSPSKFELGMWGSILFSTGKLKQF
ncbi:hypothetical protein PL8927_520037 [Planktothrix serta PCC 8927]|uniref:Uncharacterized protein n=1 Tax=Planktothrix serta PCC 8927 TaxID=671068 RepID=A0A7Z9BN54_9CYAN|nr:hypothetical protein PL8927_520037 [Planktothrix serta PCC 8927]